MRDISARELKGHNILAVERFQDNTRWMIEFSVQRPCSYGIKGYKKQRDKQIIFAYLADYKVNKCLYAYQYSSSLKNGFDTVFQLSNPC